MVGTLTGTSTKTQTGYASAVGSATGPLPMGAGSPDEELEFFERAKRAIGNKTTYNEFLKVLNLFSQELIDIKTLVERVEPFLCWQPDLYEWFKKFVKFEDDELIRKLLAFTFSLLLWCHKYEHLMLLLQPKDNVPGPSRGFDYSSSRRSGRSYRQLPAEVGLPYVKCMQNFYLGNVAEW